MTREEQTLQRIQRQLATLGPVLPGSLSEQWNVCGTPGCRCKAPSNPKKHGPYYQLSFTVAGKSSTLFVGSGRGATAAQALSAIQGVNHGLGPGVSGPGSQPGLQGGDRMRGLPRLFAGLKKTRLLDWPNTRGSSNATGGSRLMTFSCS
ncbi:MAG TPA: DUF6788 family protein [Nitrospirales bacterium]|nr:DUF6788 family protein [Nitrospirales bacterium]